MNRRTDRHTLMHLCELCMSDISYSPLAMLVHYHMVGEGGLVNHDGTGHDDLTRLSLT